MANQHDDAEFWKRQAVHYCKAFMKVAHAVDLSTETAEQHIRTYATLTIDQLLQLDKNRLLKK